MSAKPVRDMQKICNTRFCFSSGSGSRVLRYSIRNHRGFTLLEAMIGFLILSVGMLGIASLQAMALKSGKTSVYTSIATMKVDEIIESMRANPGALASYAGSGGGTPAGCTGTTNCTEAELAQDDIFWWSQNLTAGLPAAANTNIAINPVAGAAQITSVTVAVNWEERKKDAAGSDTQSVTTTAFICTNTPC